ncbi:hypothetical protein Q7A53_08480 [Halobacillus rhizosphaerae]|uniref:hypothetical protein n=1 Tax=Halobacillus rhizosphaerae TaxID=3064889 RepID=UPI00398A580C
MNKRITGLISLLAVLFVLSACSSDTIKASTSDLKYSFNNEKVSKAAGKLDFKPELPAKLPFDAKDISAESSDGVLRIHMKNEGIGFVEVQMKKKAKKVKGGDLTKASTPAGQQVKYSQNPNGKNVYWKKDHISYAITNLYKRESESLTKKQLLKMVDHFN